MLVIVTVPTEQIFTFEERMGTIKNRDGFKPDFTLHEVAAFCALLLSGDARIAETLWSDPRSVVADSDEWNRIPVNIELLCVISPSLYFSRIF
jgi:hypothetical protein